MKQNVTLQLVSLSYGIKKMAVIPLDTIVCGEVEHAQVVICSHKHVLTITGKAIDRRSSVLLPSSVASWKVQLYIFARHTNIVEINATVMLCTAQHGIESVILETIDGRVKRILPYGNITIRSSIEHAKCSIKIGSE